MTEVGGERFEEELELEQYGGRNARVLLTIDAHGMGINNKDVFPSDRWIGGSFEVNPHGETCTVLLVGRSNRHWRFQVRDRATAYRLLRAAGCDSDQGTLRVFFTFQSTVAMRAQLGIVFGAFAVALGYALSGALAFDPPRAVVVAATAVVGMLAVASLFVLTERIEVVVGTDGVLKRRRIGRATFTPFSRVRNVAYFDTTLILDRTDGPPLLIAKDLITSPFGPGDVLAELVAMRIRQMFVHNAEIAAKDPTAIETDRRSMPIASWLAEHRVSPEKVSTYRIAAEDKNFEEIFSDGSIDVVARACAAFALKVREGDSAVPRLRVAIAATASPELRGALEKIADGAPDSDIARSIEKLR